MGRAHAGLVPLRAEREKNGTFSSICDGDLTSALDEALENFDAACKALPAPSVK